MHYTLNINTIKYYIDSFFLLLSNHSLFNSFTLLLFWSNILSHPVSPKLNPKFIIEGKSFFASFKFNLFSSFFKIYYLPLFITCYTFFRAFFLSIFKDSIVSLKNLNLEFNFYKDCVLLSLLFFTDKLF
jgi:hypothetical protein